VSAAWQPGVYRVVIEIAGAPARIEGREGLICGPFAIGPDASHGVQLVHIPTGQVVAESDRCTPLQAFHERLLAEFGALDWTRRDLAALATADHYIRAQRLRQASGCRP